MNGKRGRFIKKTISGLITTALILAAFIPSSIVIADINGDDPGNPDYPHDDLTGTAGDDTINAGAGDDVVHAGDGDDTIGGDTMPDGTESTDPGDDVLYGEGGDDTIDGGAGDDTIDGGAGDDTIDGGAGDDTITGGPGEDDMDGGEGGETEGDTLVEEMQDITTSSSTSPLPPEVPGLYPGPEEGDVIHTYPFGLRRIIVKSVDSTGDPVNNDYTTSETTSTSEVDYELTDTNLITTSSGTQEEYYTTVEQQGFETTVERQYWSFLLGRWHKTRNQSGLIGYIETGDIVTYDPTGYNYDEDFSSTITERAVNFENTDLTGSEADNLMDASGFAGDATLHGMGGDDTLLGGSGNDTLDGGRGQDTYDGGDGFDTIVNTIGGDQTLTNAELSSADGNESLSSIESAVLTGDGGPNNLDASAFNNGPVTLNGLGGDDTLVGGWGDDQLNGGDGFDTIEGGTGNDTMYGEDGNDLMFGDYIPGPGTLGAGDDTMHGGLGHDTMLGNAGIDTMYGEDGDDLMTGNQGVDFIYGGDGDDILFGGSGGDTDTIYGGSGDDKIYGDLELAPPPGGIIDDDLYGNDFLFGGPGNDYIEGNGGDDIMDGGSEADELYGGAGADEMYGGDGDDTMYGNDGDDVMDGGAGDDVIDGNAGNDLITTSEGQDTIDAGAGDDIIIITGKNGNGETKETYITGGTGVNYYNFMAGTYGDLILDSNNDGVSLDTTDTLDFSLFDHGVSIDMGINTRQEVATWTEGTKTKSLWITITGFFSNLIGTNQDDTLKGNKLANSIEGRDGDDKLGGAGGVDDIYGGDKSDALNSYDASDGMDTDLDAIAVPGGVNHEDNWYSIELPVALPVALPLPAVTTTTAPAPLVFAGVPGFIPVTGGQLVKLPCDTECVTLQLPDGSIAEFCGLCDHWASLSEEYEETIPFDMPEGASMLMGMTVVLMDPYQVILDEVPAGATLKLSYLIVESMDAAALHMHLYDMGTEEWVELDETEAAGYIEAYVASPGTSILVE